MENLDLVLQRIGQQEKLLQFETFTNETALEIGLQLIEKAKKENLAVTIDICKNGQQLFHYAFSGTSPDNDQWVLRKTNVVNRFFCSSFYIHNLLKKQHQTFEEKYLLSSEEYTPHGGAFPLIIKNVGVVGSITVSGLTQHEDHQMVVKVLSDYLNVNLPD